MTAVKDKLEKLCRELQKENKKLKEDNRRLHETETRMREELHERLEGMMGDVQGFVEQKESPETLPQNLELDDLCVFCHISFPPPETAFASPEPQDIFLLPPTNHLWLPLLYTFFHEAIIH